MVAIDYKKLVNRILSKYDNANNLTIDESLILTKLYLRLTKNQKMLTRIKAGSVLVAGDIHGDFTMMRSVVDKYLKGNKADHLLFLGDIVDRGSHSIACTNLLLALILKYPDKIHIVRGNHETIPVNSKYGFLGEVMRYSGMEEKELNPFLNPENLPELYLAYNRAFNNMPLAIIHEKLRYFFVHGGIPIKPISLKEINELPKENMMLDNPIIKQLLWNDPKEYIENYGSSIRGIGIYTYGEDLVLDFLKTNNLQKIIRAHEVFPEGFRYFFDEKLLSLFSSEEYYTYVQGKVAILKENGEIKIISPKA